MNFSSCKLEFWLVETMAKEILDHFCGDIIMAIKQGNNSLDYCIKIIEKAGQTSNLEILQIIDLDPNKKELHFLAKKKG